MAIDIEIVSSGLVKKSAYTPAHSILVQQSGTGTPSALAIGNNTLVGRLSGGGSDIDDLSVSDVRTLLSIDTDLALKADKTQIITINKWNTTHSKERKLLPSSVSGLPTFLK
mgnify:CR=1 FL=1